MGLRFGSPTLPIKAPMNLNRREFSSTVGAALVGTRARGLALSARAQPGAPVEGTQYNRLQPSVPTTAGANKVEGDRVLLVRLPALLRLRGPGLEA